MKKTGLYQNQVLPAFQAPRYSQLLLTCIILLLTCICQAAPDFPALTGRVVDQANIISDQQKVVLTSRLARHEEETSNQIVVVTLSSLQGHDIADYGYQLGRNWGIGQKDKNNGVLLIVAPKQRKVRIEVGYGLEGALTDILSQQIIQDEILPHFRNGDFVGGIDAGTEAILEAVVGEYRVNPVTTYFSDRSYVPNWEGIVALFKYVLFVGAGLIFMLKRKAITTATVRKALYAIVPLYFGSWLLSASLLFATYTTSVFTIFYIIPWLAGLNNAMTLVMSTLANLLIYICLIYLLGFQPGIAAITMLAIAVIVIFPVTHYKLAFFQMKHGKTILPNSLFWCGVTISVLACVWLFIYLLDTLITSGFDLEKVGLVLIFTPFILMFGVALYMSATGKGTVGSGNRTHSRDNRHSNSSSFGSSSSSSSSSSFRSGGGGFGGGGSSGSW